MSEAAKQIVILSREERHLFEDAIARFEQAWHDTGQPAITDFLPADGSPLRKPLLQELVQIDLEFRRQRGEFRDRTEYAANFPELSTIEPEQREHCRCQPIDPPEASGARYRILHAHAKGGLGEVFLARDQELHREVALKQIQETFADRPDARERFLLEAEITGRLEHPGIVPVYGLGTYANGRPFYAMRFIKGDSLQEAVDRFHGNAECDVSNAELPPTRRRFACHVPRPAFSSLAFRKLLQRFVDVCDAIEYAHSRGVLHRDLKPGNIMLGKYGETLVVDWGLAKAKGRDNHTRIEGEATLLPASSGCSAPTQMGSAIGTPAYMSPEQAAGRLDELGPATDVYGLGTTLYYLLTGMAPFKADSLTALLGNVQSGSFVPPRQINPFIPKPLEALSLKAMSLDPKNRYSSARDLADDIERWLADQPVSAWREPWRLRTARWARAHRTLVASAAVAVVVGTLLGSAAWLWLKVDRTKREAKIEAELSQVGKLLEHARVAPPEKRQALLKEASATSQKVHGLLAGGHAGAPLHDRAEEYSIELHKAESDRRLLARLDEIQATDDDSETEYRLAFRDYGIDLEAMPLSEAVAKFGTGDTGTIVAAALDDWALVTARGLVKDRLRELAGALDSDGVRTQIRQAQAKGDSDALRELAAQARLATWPWTTFAFLGKVLRLTRMESEAETVLLVSQRRFSDKFQINMELAQLYTSSRFCRPSEAVRFASVANSLNSQSPVAFNALGNAFFVSGRKDEALPCYYRALELGGYSASPLYNIRLVVRSQGREAQELAQYREAVDRNRNDGIAHLILGYLLASSGQQAEAIEHYRIAARLRPEDAGVADMLGFALREDEQLVEAIEWARRAANLRPNAVTYNHLGFTLYRAGYTDEAVEYCRMAVELRPDGPSSLTSLSLASHSAGNFDVAVDAGRKALAVEPSPAAYSALGQALLAKGLTDEAIDHLNKAIEMTAGKAHLAHMCLGDVFLQRGQTDEAITAYRRAIEVNPKSGRAHCSLGRALQQKGELKASLDSLRQGEKLLSAVPRSSLPIADWIREVQKQQASEDNSVPR